MVRDFFTRFILFARDNSVIRRISWLTVFGMMISVASLIITLSVMTALNRSQRDRTLAVEPHLTVEFTDLRNFASIPNHPVNVVLQQLHPTMSEAYSMQDVILRTLDGKFHGAIARGISINNLKSLVDRIRSDKSMSAGLAPDEQLELAPGEVVLGHDLARSLGVFEGDTVLVVPPEGLLLPPSESPKFERVQVRKIISSYVSEVDAQTLFYVSGQTLRSLQDSSSRKLGIEVRFADPDEADRAKAALANFTGLILQTWKDRNSALFYCLFLEKTMIGVFLGIAALIAGLSLVSVLSLVISQKRKEIGLLLALGLSEKGVIRLFTRIGILLAFCGLGVGIFFGAGVSLYLEKYPLNILPDMYIDSEIPAKLQWPFLFFVVIAGGLLSIAGSWIAVRSTMSKNPSNMLRS